MIAIGRNNWLFAGSLRAGKRAAAVMSLVHSARLNGHDPYTSHMLLAFRLRDSAIGCRKGRPHSFRFPSPVAGKASNLCRCVALVPCST